MNKLIFDGENAKELSVSETIHQLRLDNKYLELQISNLQSKIDKVEKILKYDGIVEDIYYALCMLFGFEYYDDETMIDKGLLDILKED